MQENLQKTCFFLLIGITISFAFPFPAFAQSSSNIEVSSPAEAWVLEQVKLGKIANLASRFRNESDRVLSSTFLEGLLQDPSVEITRYGIRIENATFLENLDLQYLEVNHELWLNNCKFEGHVNLSEGHFTKNLFLTKSKFKFELNLYETQFDDWLYIDGAIFEDSVDLTFASVGGGVYANDAQFKGVENVSFNTMQVEKTLFLRATSFAGPVDFGYLRIGDTFDAKYIRFSNPNQTVNFNSMTIERSLFLQNAVFAGRVDFAYAQVGDIYANQIQFKNTEKIVDFYSIKVENSMNLRETVFEGPADFGRAQIGGVFDASDAQFNSNEQEINFNSMRVGGDIFLLRTVFAGPVDFGYCEVEYFNASEARFQNKENGPEFGDMVIRNLALFDQTVINGEADFDDSTFGDLSIYGAEENNTLSNIRLRRTTIQRELRLWSLQIQNIDAELLTVNGPASFLNINIVDSANFENSKFSELMISNVNWPADSIKTNLGGMQYRQIRMIWEEDGDAWNELIHLVDNSQYSAQAYTTLENYFLEQGYPERANKVYITYKRRERAEALSWNSIDWWWNLFLDGFVSYGRSPGRALVWGIAFILIGCFVFRNSENMTYSSKQEIISPTVGNRGTRSRKVPMRIKSSQSEVPYNPFWYSLDLFIPFVDLGFDDKWCPKSSCKWIMAYSKIHMLAGWILIPIGLLAITGVIS